MNRWRKFFPWLGAVSGWVFCVVAGFLLPRLVSLLLESFQQLMKEGHVVLVFVLLCALGLHVTARVCVVTAVSMAVSVGPPHHRRLPLATQVW